MPLPHAPYTQTTFARNLPASKTQTKHETGVSARFWSSRRERDSEATAGRRAEKGNCNFTTLLVNWPKTSEESARLPRRSLLRRQRRLPQDPPPGTFTPHPAAPYLANLSLSFGMGSSSHLQKGRGRSVLQVSTLLAFPKTPREERGLINHSKGQLWQCRALSSLLQDRSFRILLPR